MAPARTTDGRGHATVALGDGQASWLDDGLLTESEMLRDACNGRCARLDLPLAGVHLMGRAKLHLRFSADQPSTHLVAVLLDDSGAIISRGFMNARYRNGLEHGEDLVPGAPAEATLELIDKDFVIGDGATLILASSSATRVLSDERRANVTVDLAASTLELPTDGPEPAPAPATQADWPRTSGGRTPRRSCRRSLTIGLPRRARGRRVAMRVNGLRARWRRHGRRLAARSRSTHR